LRMPWPGKTYWKQYPKPGFAEIFFNATMDRGEAFCEVVKAIALRNGYPAEDIGQYLQPIERGRMGFHCFTFNYQPDDSRERQMVKNTYLEVSQKVMEMGGLFTNPYGVWAKMVYGKVTGFDTVVRSVKRAFDPQGILNPGTLLDR